ncbi:hypothetical protein Tco_0128342 [Tanacetum coccineum]
MNFPVLFLNQNSHGSSKDQTLENNESQHSNKEDEPIFLKEHAITQEVTQEALAYPSWVEAMQEELLQFRLQKVWALVDLPNGK